VNFLSFAYLLFLPVVFAIHWAVPARWRWATVLASSVWFVASVVPASLVPMAAATLLAWAAGLVWDRHREFPGARPLFAVAVAAPLAALAVYKYAGFAAGIAAQVARTCGFGPQPGTVRLALPLGISFWTFSIVSYLLDVRRGAIRAERHPGRFAAYILFFPKLVAGPIDRAGNFLPQLAVPEPFSHERASLGMRQIALGLFRKAVVADYLASFTDAAFASPGRFNSSGLLLAAVLYSVQIYNDFAGYSDMAIGSARLLGIDLADNFRAPVFARSLKEFWGRWHISLSTWFRDYVYIPLGGSRRGAWRTRANLLATFVLSGLWHGANWTFVVWGGIHGLAQIAEKAVFPSGGRGNPAPPRHPVLAFAVGVARWAATFLVVTAAWVFFRAETLSGAWAYLAKMSRAWHAPIAGMVRAFRLFSIDSAVAARLFLPLLVLGAWDFLSLKRDPFGAVSRLPGVARWALHAAAVAAILYVLLPQGESARDFIYFRF
jgi:D-alanyl-lipoteichoic acid acyltransferase DltB (MBOAT superfamily)